MNSLAPVFLGLLSALCWGAGDFSCGYASKKLNVYGVVIGSQFVGIVLLLALSITFNEGLPTQEQIIWGGAAGIAGAIGLISLYRALAVGRMGVAAPVSAVISALVPAIAGTFFEGLPKVLQLVGFAIAIIGVWFISRTDDSKIHFEELGLPAIAGLGFGLFLIFINRVSSEAVFLPLVASRAASLLTTIVFAAFTKQLILPQIKDMPLVALGGAMDAAGNAFYAFASQVGRLDVAAVLSSLYPSSTIWLAWLILKEKFSRVQTFGILATLIAIVLIAL